jgi:hypothetical protein
MAWGVRRLAFTILLAGCGQAFTSIVGDGGPTGTQTSPSLLDGSGGGGAEGGALVDAAVHDAQDDGAAPVPDAPADALADAPTPPPPACAVVCPAGFACINGKCEDHAALHFSAIDNPSLNWSYGSASSLGTAFVAFPAHWVPLAAGATMVDFWSSVADSYIPSVFHNGATTTALYATLVLVPGQLGFWPGPTGGIAIVRWTPPAAGSYSINVVFEGVSYVDGGTAATVEVGVRMPGSIIPYSQTIGTSGSANLASYGPTPATAMVVTDFVEFFVNYGTNLNAVADGTALDAVITAN